MKFSLKCTCGDVMTVDAASRDEAVAKFKEMMGPDAVAAHFAEKHAGQPVPPMDQVTAMIDSGVVEGDLNDQGGTAPMSGPQPGPDAGAMGGAATA